MINDVTCKYAFTILLIIIMIFIDILIIKDGIDMINKSHRDKKDKDMCNIDSSVDGVICDDLNEDIELINDEETLFPRNDGKSLNNLVCIAYTNYINRMMDNTNSQKYKKFIEFITSYEFIEIFMNNYYYKINDLYKIYCELVDDQYTYSIDSFKQKIMKFFNLFKMDKCQYVKLNTIDE